ncbi:MAG: hypothetical protein JJU29_17100 [Verrucomicrobia bacterium]|nr:hypothetical protein [Verrucomicrobiota bacterium]
MGFRYANTAGLSMNANVQQTGFQPEQVHGSGLADLLCGESVEGIQLGFGRLGKMVFFRVRRLGLLQQGESLVDAHEFTGKLQNALKAKKRPGESFSTGVRRAVFSDSPAIGAELFQFFSTGGGDVSEAYLDAVEENIQHDPPAKRAFETSSKRANSSAQTIYGLPPRHLPMMKPLSPKISPSFPVSPV